jgi:predicted methyltransferase
MSKSVPYLAVLPFAVLLICLSAHADTPTPTPTPTPTLTLSEVALALADPRRPADQVSLDATRKPAQLITFAQLKRGYRIAEFMPGNAYFTRIMSDIVGDSGHIYAFLPSEQLANCPPREVAGTRLLERDPGYANVSVLSDAAANFRAPQKLDVIWTAQNYHDLHDPFMGPADVAALNKRFFDALKPGGIYLVIDHVAESGSGLRDTESLHRIDPLRMRREIEAAGFIFDAESNVLRNASDDHKSSVFDRRVRGRTDQVVYKFRKHE